MSYIFCAVASAVFLALYDFFKKISVKGKKDVKEILFFFTFIACLCSLFFVKEAFSIDIKYILFIFLKSFIISLSWTMTTKAMSKLDMSIVVPFSMLGTIFTTILAKVFFDEDIGPSQVGGMAVILLGLFLLSRLNSEKEKKSDYKYLFLLVFAAILSSFSGMIDKKLLSNIDKGSVLFWFFFFLSFIYLIVCLFKNKKIVFKNFTSNLWIIGVGVSIFVSDLLYYYVVSGGVLSLSIISILKKLSVFIGVVLASIFLKEKYFFKKLMILILMFIGLGLIMFI